MMITGCACAEGSIIGGADGPTAIYVGPSDDPVYGSLTITLPGNATTGYEWTAFVLGGNSVEIDEAESSYASLPDAEGMTGAGGIYTFKLNALQPGESLVRFTYARSWEGTPANELLLLVVVEDDLLIYAMEVTETSALEGTVTQVNEDSVLLLTETVGEVLALFPEGMALPVEEECIRIYTNGTMTASLPPICNVIAWETIPSDAARGDNAQDAAYEAVLQAAASLQELAGDKTYLSLLGAPDEITTYINDHYASTIGMTPVNTCKLDGITNLAKILYGGIDTNTLSETARQMLEKSFFSSSIIATQQASTFGTVALAATSVLKYDTITNDDLPSSFYLFEYENDTGIIVGIWNNLHGQNLITASFVPGISQMQENEVLSVLFK